MMMRMSVTEARRSFSKVIAMVESGNEVAITRHGKTAAVLLPIEDTGSTGAGNGTPAISDEAKDIGRA
jgi:prevent-host-death family protein